MRSTIAEQRPARGAPVAGQQAHDREEGLALARAALPHHRQRFARVEREAEVRYRLHLGLVQRKGDVEIFDLKDRAPSAVLRIEGVAQAVAEIGETEQHA